MQPPVFPCVFAKCSLRRLATAQHARRVTFVFPLESAADRVDLLARVWERAEGAPVAVRATPRGTTERRRNSGSRTVVHIAEQQDALLPSGGPLATEDVGKKSRHRDDGDRSLLDQEGVRRLPGRAGKGRPVSAPSGEINTVFAPAMCF